MNLCPWLIFKQGLGSVGASWIICVESSRWRSGRRQRQRGESTTSQVFLSHGGCSETGPGSEAVQNWSDLLFSRSDGVPAGLSRCACILFPWVESVEELPTSQAKSTLQIFWIFVWLDKRLMCFFKSLSFPLADIFIRFTINPNWQVPFFEVSFYSISNWQLIAMKTHPLPRHQWALWGAFPVAPIALSSHQRCKFRRVGCSGRLSSRVVQWVLKIFHIFYHQLEEAC